MTLFCPAIQAALALLCPGWADPPCSEPYPTEIHEFGYSAKDDVYSSKEGLGDAKDCKIPIEFLELPNPLDRLHMPIVPPLPPHVINPPPITDVDP